MMKHTLERQENRQKLERVEEARQKEKTALMELERARVQCQGKPERALAERRLAQWRGLREAFLTHYIRVSLAWGIFFCKKEAALFTKALQKKRGSGGSGIYGKNWICSFEMYGMFGYDF